jgi:hypothetical protein
MIFFASGNNYHCGMAERHNGASRQGDPAMPAWNGRLSDREIEDAIA